MLNDCEWWCEIWKSGSIINRWHSEKWGFIRHGSSARLLHSLGGRLVCIVSPLSHLRSEGMCFDKCCPYCPVKCTCRSTDTFKTIVPVMLFNPELKEDTENVYMEVDGCVLTLYHTEYSRALVMFSRMTRCHDMSSPAECWKTSNLIGLWLTHD